MAKDETRKTRRKCAYTVEVRYQPIVEIFDCRGHLLSVVYPHFKERMEHWSVESAAISVLDDLTEPSRRVYLGHQRAFFTFEDVDSLDQFRRDVRFIFESLLNSLGTSLKITRVGARLKCIHEMPRASNFEVVSKALSKVFLARDHPFAEGMKDFKVVFDTALRHVEIGPVRKAEPWIEQAFVKSTVNVPDFGVGIDVDSFLVEDSLSDNGKLLEQIENALELTSKTETEIVEIIKAQAHGA